MFGHSSTLSSHVHSFSTFSSTRPGVRIIQRCPSIKMLPRTRTLCTASLDPWKTLGIPHDADDADIKKAYRKLVLQHHPDLKGSQAAQRFVKIQEAYEVVTGKRRGSTVEAAQQPAKAGSWDFHDWYWNFTASKRWDKQKHKKPSSAPPPPRPTGATKEALQEQLAGLRRKAAFRRVSRHTTPEAAQDAAGSPAGAPTSPFAQSSAAAGPSRGQEGARQGHASASHSSRDHVLASSQLAGLKRRAALRTQARQPEDSSPAAGQQGQAGVGAQGSSSYACSGNPSPASVYAPAGVHVPAQSVQEEHAPASSQNEHFAAVGSSGAQSVHEAGSGQEANGAVPWPRQQRVAHGIFASASALSMSALAHPLGEVDIVKCMRELTSHLSWR